MTFIRYTLSFSASEQIPANFLEGATEVDPFAGMASTVTVTSGSDLIISILDKERVICLFLFTYLTKKQ